MNLIESHGLTRRFWRTEAVHDLSFTLPAGGVTALLGPNGAGKTTTLRMLVNLLRPTAGEARVFGCPTTRLGPSDYARLGYVSENQKQPLWMTVAQFLAFCRPLYPTWDRDLEAALLKRFALPLNRKLKHLSRGMLMQTVFLSCVAYRPALLILDEPFTGLDPVVRQDVIDGLLEASASGETTTLISSHDIDDVERLCDRVLFLESGRLHLDEPTDSLLRRHRRVDVRLDTPLPPNTALPQGWTSVERGPNQLRFVDTAYDPDRTEEACRTHFPSASVTAVPLSLKDIFVHTVRQRRGTTAAA
jgi:ABC-2 type transport system ATP-binding protein